jgi:hypothetical protein
MVQMPTISVDATRKVISTASLLTSQTLSVTGQLGQRAQLIQTPTISVSGTRKQFPIISLTALVTIQNIGRQIRNPIHRTIYARPPISHPFRLIVQRILDGKIVDWDLNVNSDFQYTKQLSGPTIMSGSFREALSIQELGLDGYAFWFHVEIDNEIRASAVMLPPQYQENGLSFTCEGVSAIPHWHDYGGVLTGVGLDPLSITRNIWNYVQSQPDSNYGVTLTQNLSGIKLGTPARTETIPPVPPDTESTIREIDAEPYELVWWEGTNCGEEIDSLAQEAPFDYIERSKYTLAKDDVAHFIDLGFPRVGTARPNLIFNEENILEIVPVQEAEDAYASTVIIVGAGEGRDAIRGQATRRFGIRVPKTVTITDKNVKTTAHANSMAVEEVNRRQGKLFEISEISIKGNHEYAPQGSYSEGDDISVEVEIPWLLERYKAWYRIIAISVKPSSDIIRLSLKRADSFRYPIPTLTT